MILYCKYMLIHLKSQMQYRVSFWLLTLGQSLGPVVTFAGLYFMFERFGNLRGWSLYEAALCYAVIGMAFSLSEMFARGFDTFSSLVINGDFDRLLVRPRNTVLQVLGSKFEFARAGRLVQSCAILAWALYHLPGVITVPKMLTLLLMISGGVLVFTGIFIAAASLSFWTVQGLEVANVFTDGGREMAKYPLNIYRKWVKTFYTFIIPLGCINYMPLLYLVGRADGNEILYMLTPFAGVVFIFPCLLAWNIGVRHYRSTGS
ncbi:ABC transporter permease [Paenibacillus alkalitolerans]|uniref:ABC transporter permease n=1 Tax=Paenibacillus alkalitolerans TaxID=2799335 RepID=UPI0018F63353|nr:ABC-2 family transporter protein [Paenibacillus alkalitolerans]